MNARATSSRPRVSVVLPTYNQLAFLPAAIESLQHQTFSDFELVIVNDGCTDGTRAYLSQLPDPRIRVIHQANQGLPRALNAGFEAAQGELLTWTSSDNYCAPVYLEALVRALEAHPEAGLAVSAFAWVDEAGRIQHITRDQDLSYRSFLCSNPGVAAFLYRRACQVEVGDYEPALNGAEDWDMWLRILERFEIVYVPEILYYYRQHGGSITARVPEEVRSASCAVVEHALARGKQELELSRLYPGLERCTDIDAANADACSDFGARLLRSPFWHPAIACRFLEAGLRLRPNDPALAANLAIACARAQDFERALSLASELRNVDDPQLRTVCNRIEESARSQAPQLAQGVAPFRPAPATSGLLDSERRREFSLTSALSGS